LHEYSLIQIGDIHYQYIDNSNLPLDRKDKNFPKKLIDVLPKPIIQTILKDLLKEINQNSVGIFICGDLTTYGQIDFYLDCLSFLKDRIPVSFFIKETDKRIFIVPGNHDIDRDLVEDDEFLPKFTPIKYALKTNGFPDIPYPKIIVENYPKNSKRKILVLAINSCLGCGERRYYPDSIKEELSKLLDYRSKGEKNGIFKDICYENLDTPLISTEDIDKVFNSIDSFNNNCLPIILTHHNLLPQRIPRIDIYTELINSGYLREKLLELDRPILFLHGHIHDDPIEIIQSSIYKDGRIICISAPLFAPSSKYLESKIGFNKIRIIYGEFNVPIGCEVTLYRLDKMNYWKSKKVRIPLRNPQRSIVFADDISRQILSIIDNQMYVGDLKNEYKKIFLKSISLKNLSSALEQLDWLGLIEYDQNDAPIASKIVRKVIP